MKKLLSLVFIFIFVLSIPFSAYAYKPTFKTHAKAGILYNVDTDTVVYSDDIDKKIYPASLTKIMVAILLVEAEEDLEDLTLTVSEEVYLEYRYSEAVIAGFETGDKVNGHDLLAYTMVKSCADASAVIAEHIAGSEEEFIKMMNDKAKEIGMNNTHFTNCHGLHDPDHYSTVRDLCILTKYAMQYSVITDVVKVARYITQDDITLAATNLLIDPNSGYHYSYATGFKTGYTTEAGRCLAATATYEGMTYISILVGCPPQDNSLENRYEFIDTAELFRWAFTNFEYRSVLGNSETIDGIPIDYSWDYDTVNIRPDKEVFALIPKDADLSTVEIKVDYQIKRAEAPVKKGDVVGTVNLYYADEKIGSTDAVIAESVEGSQLLKVLSSIEAFFKRYKTVFFLCFFALFVLLIIFIIITIRLNSKKKRYGSVKRYRRF